MLLPLTEFTDYSETVFSIDNYWVFSLQVYTISSYTSKVDFPEVWDAICAFLGWMRGVMCKQSVARMVLIKVWL